MSWTRASAEEMGSTTRAVRVVMMGWARDGRPLPRVERDCVAFWFWGAPAQAMRWLRKKRREKKEEERAVGAGG